MKLKTILSAIGIAASSFLLASCGNSVDIPPAHVGKLSTKNGLQEGIIPPSKIWISGFCMTCDTLVLAEASDYPVEESMRIFMPKDKLNIDLEARGTFSISNEERNVEMIFARLSADPTDNDSVSKISIEEVYKVYAAPVLRDAVRSVVTKYSIQDLMENRDSIGQELLKTIRIKLADSPITALNFGLADIQPPKVIIDAQESAKQREIDIKKAESDKLVKMKQAEASLEIATKQQQVDLKEAETQLLVDKKLAEGVSAAFIAQRALKVMEQLAASDNKVIFMPTEAMSNPAVMLGSINDALNKNKEH